MAAFGAHVLQIIVHLSACTFAVTVIPTTLNLPRPYPSEVKPVTADYELLAKLDPKLEPVYGLTGPYFPDNLPAEVVMASTWSISSGRINATDRIYAEQDSFVRGAIEASAKHQHLAFRPDDVWFTILTQRGFYMQEHKDEQLVRDMWDSWEGQPFSANNAWLMIAGEQNQWVDYEFQQRSKAKWLLDWV